MNAKQRDYRTLLRDELETRCHRNARYSLRAFARDIGISAPRLSRILNGHFGLSVEAAREIAQKLAWSDSETVLFCDLVESRHARSRARRTIAQGKVRDYRATYRDLGTDSFRVISDWYHFAIMELTQVEGFDSSEAWIAKQLGISVHEARSAIDRLKRLDLVCEKSGKLRLTGQYFANAGGAPSDAVRKFHRQFLELAGQSLLFQGIGERDHSAIVLAVDADRLDEARADIRKFTQKFDAKYSASKKKTRVYGLGVQFFGLQIQDQKEPSE